MTHALSNAISDISALGAILNALEAVPRAHADAGVLLPGAAAIGRRVAALAEEVSGSLPEDGAGAGQALSEAGRLGQALGALDAIPERAHGAGKLLRGAAALGRSIEVLASEASEAPGLKEATAFALAKIALAQAREGGHVPPHICSVRDFREIASNVEHGGVLIGAHFFSCDALQPMHGERVRVLTPNADPVAVALVLDLDGRLIGVATPEASGDQMRPVPGAAALADAVAAELGDEVAGRQPFPLSLGVACPADAALDGAASVPN
ncbi:hypothetical protein [Methylocystis parvus]|uniref:hypothetical protein n=1 Tax=Methylocystis parvus TaxID=134 RepID=UPI003C78C9A0